MKIILYTKEGCPWSAGARAFLGTQAVSFEERNVSGNSEYKEEVQKATGQNSSPTAKVGDQWVLDASLERINEAIKKAA